MANKNHNKSNPFKGYYFIIAKRGGKCLDVQGFSKANNVKVFQWSLHMGDNQQWKFRKTPDGYYHIISKNSGKCLDVAGAVDKDYGIVFQYQLHGGDNQKWSLQPIQDNYFRIIAKHSGKALQVDPGSQHNGADVFQYHITDNDSQKWELRRAVVPLRIRTKRTINRVFKVTSQAFRPIMNFLRSRWFLVIFGLAIIFLSIAYWSTLLDNWPWGGFGFIKWMEIPVEVFGALLILIGFFSKGYWKRKKAIKVAFILLALFTGATYGYYYLDNTGKIDEWLNRSAQEDTLSGMIKDKIPTIAETIGELRTTTEDKIGDVGDFISDVFSDDRVWIDGAYLVGAKGNPITLHNNPNAKNPSWSQLVGFLDKDNTDKQTYSRTFFVCADFAEMLHNNAEEAGWRCAYVCVDLSIGEHALNAFETTDRGLVYIDCTNSDSLFAGPESADKIVDVQVGKEYIPESIFPSPGWYSTWGSMGIVTEIEIIKW